MQNEGARYMQEITFAVLGDIGVGKSTFIQRALDLKNNVTSLSSIKKVSLDRVVSILRLVEFRLQDLQLSEDCSVCWPTIIGNQNIPRIDGTLVLCDVMDKSSMFNIDSMLSKFSFSFNLVMHVSGESEISHCIERRNYPRVLIHGTLVYHGPYRRIYQSCNANCYRFY